MPSDDLGYLPKTDNDFRNWGFSNVASHRDINRVIFQTLGIVVPEYPIYPMNLDNPVQWGWQHQAMHSASCQALGIASYNLVTINWDDARYMDAWNTLHFDEHNRLEAALGL